MSIAPGQAVRCITTDRLGVVLKILAPPREDRTLWVMWSNRHDFSLMRAEELVMSDDSLTWLPRDSDWMHQLPQQP